MTDMNGFEDIPKLDKNHIFDAIDAQPNQLRQNYADEMSDDITPDWGEGIENIVLAGMGGSALGAELVLNWLGDKLTVPFQIVRGYNLPGYVTPKSLVILSSYSGNTEETLAAYLAARKRSARIVVMAHGGQLLEEARVNKHLVLQLPATNQPRFAALAQLRALVCLLSDAGLAGDVDLRRELEDAADWLDIAKSRFSLDNQDDDNRAMQIARSLHGKPVVVYGGFGLRAAVYKWKIDINENAKQLAWCNVFPELNHNEFQGWIFPLTKHLATVQLQSPHENPRILRRLEVTRDMLKDHGYHPEVITAEGDTPLKSLLWTVMLGDYTSSYLGILNGIDPNPVDMVESFKKKLG